MREIRVYQPGHYELGDTIELDVEAGRHVATVLRLKEGHLLTLFSGDNREFEARIASVHKSKVSVTLSGVHTISRESPKVIHLAQGISKGDRMETVVQKAVELGVYSVTPLLTKHCSVKLDVERMEKKRRQWQSIAIAACEQCGRNIIPVIQPVISLEDYISVPLSALNVVLYPESSKNWRDHEFSSAGSISLLVGPEGGLHVDEIQLLFAQNFRPLNLGPRILRTETAAIAALSVVQALCGDL